jgi:hypothetical protein
MAQVREIADQKMGDMNAVDVEGAMQMVMGICPCHGPRSRGGLRTWQETGKNLKAAYEAIDRNKAYGLAEGGGSGKRAMQKQNLTRPSKLR